MGRNQTNAPQVVSPLEPLSFLAENTNDAKSLSIYGADWDSEKALSGIDWDEGFPNSQSGEEDREKLDAVRPEIESVEHVRASEALQTLNALAGTGDVIS